LNQITVGDIAEFGEEYLEESAVEITRQIETTVIDIEALVTSLRRLANAAADAGDGND
jgi:small-conductance mechanosensitive channel